MFVAGSRPAGQSPAKPAPSRTVSEPPAFGATLLAGAWVLEVPLPPQAAAVRASSKAVPPRQNLRTVLVEPSLMAFTHSISKYVTRNMSSVQRFVLDIRIRPELPQGSVTPCAVPEPALVTALARTRPALVPHPQRLGWWPGGV